VYVALATALVERPDDVAMAFRVVVALMGIALEYLVDEVVGVLPSVV
jgi:hypothetical protein